MLNVSPIGRNCSQEERDEFERYDKVRENFFSSVPYRKPIMSIVCLSDDIILTCLS